MQQTRVRIIDQPLSQLTKAQRAKILARFWNRMSATFPYRWQAALGDVGSDGFVTWQEAMMDLTATQIRKGLAVTVQANEEHIPSIPLFRKRCLGKTTSFPSLAETIEMVLKKHYRGHPLVWHIADSIGHFALRQMSESQARAAIKPLYQAWAEAILAGHRTRKTLIRGETVGLDLLTIPAFVDQSAPALPSPVALERPDGGEMKDPRWYLEWMKRHCARENNNAR